MQKNAYTPKHSSTKLTKALLIIVWLLIVALILSMGYLFFVKAKQIDGSAAASDTAKAGFNKSALVVVFDDSFPKEVAPAFILLNFNSISGEISVASLPTNIASTVDAKSGSLLEQYQYGGILQLKQAVDNVCNINLSYYAAIECEQLESVADIMGSIKFNVKDALYSKAKSGAILCDIKKGEQSLGAQQFTEYFRYTGWSVEQRAAMLSDFTVAMINAYSTDEISQKIADLFGEIATEMQTNVSVLQINELQGSYKSFTVLKSTAAQISVAETDGILNEKTLKKISETF